MNEKIEEDKWIKLSDRLPDEFPCQVWMPGLTEPIISLRRYGATVGCAEGWPLVWNTEQDSLLTHWKSLKLSDPPEPEVSEDDDKAFDEWFSKPESRGQYTRGAWRAALAWERSRKKE